MPALIATSSGSDLTAFHDFGDSAPLFTEAAPFYQTLRIKQSATGAASVVTGAFSSWEYEYGYEVEHTFTRKPLRESMDSVTDGDGLDVAAWSGEAVADRFFAFLTGGDVRKKSHAAGYIAVADPARQTPTFRATYRQTGVPQGRYRIVNNEAYNDYLATLETWLQEVLTAGLTFTGGVWVGGWNSLPSTTVDLDIPIWWWPGADFPEHDGEPRVMPAMFGMGIEGDDSLRAGVYTADITAAQWRDLRGLGVVSSDYAGTYHYAYTIPISTHYEWELS